MPVLALDSAGKLQLHTQSLVGRSVAVLGITGSGKTNTAAVLIEELLRSGLPLTIVDIEGEYWGLKEQFKILVAGRSSRAELEIGPGNAGRLAEISVQRRISVILDLSDFTQDEAYAVLDRYFTSLWAACSAARQPYQVVLEEAHEFVPQSVNTPLKQILTRIALRGRKRGLGIILVSQRSARVEKDVLTQASLLFLHKVVHPIDLKVYKELIPLSSSHVEEMIQQLGPGEVIVVYNHQVHMLHIRMRSTFHVGATPSYEPAQQPELRHLDEATLQELRQLITSADQPGTTDDQARLRQRIRELEATLAVKEQEIQKLQDQVDLLSKLSISIGQQATDPSSSRPQTLNVDRAIVHRVIAGEAPTLPASPEAPPLSEPRQAAGIALSPLEQRKLDSLKRRIQKLPRLHRSILRLLIEHEGKTLSVSTMATWLSLKESTIRSRPPLDLIKMKLITRTRSGRSYHYTSTASAYLKAEFPHAHPEVLLERLLG